MVRFRNGLYAPNLGISKINQSNDTACEMPSSALASDRTGDRTRRPDPVFERYLGVFECCKRESGDLHVPPGGCRCGS
jgi:hypothetical protein